MQRLLQLDETPLGIPDSHESSGDFGGAGVDGSALVPSTIPLAGHHVEHFLGGDLQLKE